MTNEERAALTTSCGDGSCILRDGPVRGMQTNGGCQHLKERGPQLNALLHALGAEVVRLRALVAAAGSVISEIGCECACACDEEHDDDCEGRCSVCRIADALQPEYRGAR